MGADVATLVTAEQFAAMQPGEGRQQLVEGRVVMAPPVGGEHARSNHVFSGLLFAWECETGLGRGFGTDMGFLVSHDPDTVLAPDACYFRADRLPEQGKVGWHTEAPDLVVEVVSPRDRPGQVMAKVGQWLDFGVQAVVVLWPSTQRVTVHRAVELVDAFDAEATLAIDDVLPGFRAPVARLFS